MSSQVAVIGITGATGFVGSALVEHLLDQTDSTLRVAVRHAAQCPSIKRVDVVRMGELGPDNRWDEFVAGVDVVVHCAARVHVLDERSADAALEYHQANVLGTVSLARQAASAGVKRFIFLSSIKVNGESTHPGTAFVPDGPCQPQDPYGVSKMNAEQALREVAARTGMEVVIIRPVLVYGPGVKANFLNMMRWLDRGLPLPLGAVRNRRSLVALDNLVDLITLCMVHPAAANQTFLVSDDRDLSTAELLRKVGDALGTPARLIPVPEWILRAGAAALGKKTVVQRLCGSLQVDISKTRHLLGWVPPSTVEAAMKKTALRYLDTKSNA